MSTGRATRWVRALAVLAGLLATGSALPAPAGAASVDVSSEEISYSAAAGETNDLTVSHAGAEFVFSDDVAIDVGTGPCVNAGTNTARCPDAGISLLEIELGDLNDRGAVDASVPSFGNSFSQQALMAGDAGNDNLTGGPNLINILLGNSIGGDGPGTDTLTGGPKTDLLSGSDGADVANGGGGPDFLSGGSGPDHLLGGDGRDFFGDVFFGGEPGPDGADVIEGGRDSDGLTYSGRSGDVTADTDGVADDGEACPGPACEGDNVGADVEGIDGGNGNDVLTGGEASNVLFGSEGDDVIDGGGGADGFLSGGDGNDSVSGGDGNDVRIFGDVGSDSLSGGAGDDVLFSALDADDADTLAGGPGLDLADYGDANSAITVDLDGKADDGVAGENDNVQKSVEDVVGTPFNDVLKGNKRDNELVGGDGNDKLVGSGGLDGINGGRGDDRINGGKGADLLEGEAGADNIKSRDGKRDQVTCGSAVDKVKADRADRLTADCDKVKRRR